MAVGEARTFVTQIDAVSGLNRAESVCEAGCLAEARPLARRQGNAIASRPSLERKSRP